MGYQQAGLPEGWGQRGEGDEVISWRKPSEEGPERYGSPVWSTSFPGNTRRLPSHLETPTLHPEPLAWSRTSGPRASFGGSPGIGQGHLPAEPFRAVLCDQSGGYCLSYPNNRLLVLLVSPRESHMRGACELFHHHQPLRERSATILHHEHHKL